jgi:Integrase core domain
MTGHRGRCLQHLRWPRCPSTHSGRPGRQPPVRRTRRRDRAWCVGPPRAKGQVSRRAAQLKGQANRAYRSKRCRHVTCSPDSGPSHSRTRIRWSPDPRPPTHYPFIEGLSGQFREECLNQVYVTSLEDARERVEAWRVEYNERRPHRALGNLAPREVAASKARNVSAPSVRSALVEPVQLRGAGQRLN